MVVFHPQKDTLGFDMETAWQCLRPVEKVERVYLRSNSHMSHQTIYTLELHEFYLQSDFFCRSFGE